MKTWISIAAVLYFVAGLLDSEAPLTVRLALGAAAAGAVLLLVHVARVRLKNRASDPYEEVIR